MKNLIAIALIVGNVHATASAKTRTLRDCEEYATSPERADCRTNVLWDCPKTPLKAWKKCWDSHK